MTTAKKTKPMVPAEPPRSPLRNDAEQSFWDSVFTALLAKTLERFRHSAEDADCADQESLLDLSCASTCDACAGSASGHLEQWPALGRHQTGANA
jgi:hypothetical protein